jgi:hypothetical protein
MPATHRLLCMQLGTCKRTLSLTLLSANESTLSISHNPRGPRHMFPKTSASSHDKSINEQAAVRCTRLLVSQERGPCGASTPQLRSRRGRVHLAVRAEARARAPPQLAFLPFFFFVFFVALSRIVPLCFLSASRSTTSSSRSSSNSSSDGASSAASRSLTR